MKIWLTCLATIAFGMYSISWLQKEILLTGHNYQNVVALALLSAVIITTLTVTGRSIVHLYDYEPSANTSPVDPRSWKEKEQDRFS